MSDDREDNQAYLWEEVEKFITDNEITCPEAIMQTDWVIENAYDFIERLCDIVGYYKEEESNE